MKTGSKDDRVRGWRSWGGAMPAPRSSRRRVAYLFQSPRPQVERAADLSLSGYRRLGAAQVANNVRVHESNTCTFAVTCKSNVRKHYDHRTVYVADRGATVSRITLGVGSVVH